MAATARAAIPQPGRAYKVSYNRPITTRGGGTFPTGGTNFSGPQDYIFGVEYPAIQWLEKNGYDVSYMTGVDSDRLGNLIKNHKMFLSVGHDEYWSGPQRANVEAARDAGVNLSFWSGNEVYWKTRWEPSISAGGQAYRTLVTYKETRAGPIDPNNEWTGTFRDPRFASPTSLGAGRPENALTGTIFQVDSYRSDAITIPYDDANLRFWRNTSVANLQPGQSATLTQNYLGYEWDASPDNGVRPAGLIELSSTTLPVTQYLLDYGTQTGSATATHNLTLYRAPSGALVFGAGTVYWAWGLDSNHDLEATPVDPRVKQAMVNLLADMGIQPGTLESGLVAATQSTDVTKPVSAITAPNDGTALKVGQAVTITGTASDVGGVIASVEVTTDNGATWHRATGDESWTYSWVPSAAGTFTIKTRAVDDSLNLEAPGTGRTVTVTGNNIFSASTSPPTVAEMDGNSIELGVKFQSSVAGTVSGVRFFRNDLNIGTHTGTLWSSTGTKLATATFTNETGNGWQAVSFSSPITITANTQYVASYHTSGYYSATTGGFSSGVTNGPLSTPSNAGVYRYGTTSAFPNLVFNSENYWVDVLFNPGSPGPNQAPTAVNDSGFTTTNTAVTIPVLANDTDPDGDPLTVTGVSNFSNGTAAIQNNAVIFTPSNNYTGPAGFSYAISDGRGGTASATVSLSVNAPGSGPVSLFSGSETPAVLSDSDTAQVELGMKFQATAAGTVSGVKFYKGTGDNGTHTGTLWTSTGTQLATLTFTNETSTGWQTATFSNPITVTPNATYVVSYHSSGHYASTGNYFASAVSNGPLTAPSSSASGGNGVYLYGARAFPTQTFGATNYWVDVLFTASATNAPPTATNLSAAESYTEDTPLNLTDIVVSDADSANVTATLTLSNPAAGSLTTATSGAVTSTYIAGTGVWTASGAIADVNALLAGVTFTPAANFNGNFSIATSVSDGVAPAITGTKAFTGTAVNDAPTATNLSASESYTEDTPLNLIDIVVSDIDSAL